MGSSLEASVVLIHMAHGGELPVVLIFGHDFSEAKTADRCLPVLGEVVRRISGGFLS